VLLMMAIMASVGMWSVLRGETIQVNDTFIYDGRFYGPMAQTLDLRAFDSYHFSRMLPSAVVHAGLVACGQPLDRRHIVPAFQLLNLGAVLLACLFYGWIGDEIGMSAAALWLGFIAIFVNFIHLKFIWYNPVVTDGVAASLSLAMLLCFLKGKQWLLIVVTLLGAFTWPTLIYAGGFLLAFPRRPMEAGKSLLSRWMAAGFAAVVAGLSLVFLLRASRTGFLEKVPHVHGAVVLDLILCVLYAYVATAGLLRGISVASIWKAFSPRRAIIAVVLGIVVSIPAWLWANHALYAWSMGSILYRTLFRAMLHPLGFLVAHPENFGPAFLLLYLYWRPFARIVQRYGIGLMLVTWMGILTAMVPESRQSLPSYMMAAPFLGLLADELALPARFVGLVGVMAVAMSRIWVHLGVPSAGVSAAAALVPRNLVVNEQGTWMTNRIYVIKLVVVLVSMGILLLARRIFKGTSTLTPPPEF
jgi:hypothetical protein